MTFRRLASLLAAVCLGSSAWAQGFPSKPITLVVPFSPGGVTDTTARNVAKSMGDMLGQQVMVEN